MRRILLLLSLLFLVVSGVVSRSQEIGLGPGPSWHTYTVKDEEFSVTLPYFPGMATSKVARKGDGKRRLERRLTEVFNGVHYSIEAFENPKPRQSLEQFIDELGITGEYEYDAATKRPLTIDGFAGIAYSSANKTVAAVALFVATEKHLYRFIAAGPDEERRAVMQFFSSIKLGKEPNGIEVSDGPQTPVQLYNGERVYTGREVDVKARLLTKPEPNYTEDARKNNISGLVILKVIFAKNGEVENIRVVSGLPYGLTEQAITAARKIKFSPAMKDGKPVSIWMQLEYNFNQ